MWIEQEKGDLACIKARFFRDAREWWGLIRRWTHLGRRYHVARLAPPMSNAKPIGGIGSENWRICQKCQGDSISRAENSDFCP